MTPTIGSIAAALFRAEETFLRAEAALEQLLDALYGRDGWESLEFERHDRVLDVYGVVPGDEQLGVLWLAGFARVAQHPHSNVKFSGCDCKSRRPS